jgi:hypothetical protein
MPGGERPSLGGALAEGQLLPAMHRRGSGGGGMTTKVNPMCWTRPTVSPVARATARSMSLCVIFVILGE